MSVCSFLSANNELVECFCECPFYNYSELEGQCPFEQVNDQKFFDAKNLSDYDLFKDDKNSPISILYK